MTWVLSGCAAMEWIVSNADSIEKGGDTAEGFGAYGVIASLVASNVVSVAKWWEGKKTTKDLVSAVQKSKKDLTPEAKKILTDGFDKHMPSKVKAIVSKIKKKI